MSLKYFVSVIVEQSYSYSSKNLPRIIYTNQVLEQLNLIEDLRDWFDKRPWRLYDLIYRNHPRYWSKISKHNQHKPFLFLRQFLLVKLYLDSFLWISMFVEYTDRVFDELNVSVVSQHKSCHLTDRLSRRELNTKSKIMIF